MPAKDAYHNTVVTALEKDGWTITHDPLTMAFGPKDVYVDLGAERLLGAERGTEKIAVEIKVFGGRSELRDLENAVGQYLLYYSLLRRHPDQLERRLFLAVTHTVFENLLQEAIVRPLFQDFPIAVVTFNPESEEIVQWIP